VGCQTPAPVNPTPAIEPAGSPPPPPPAWPHRKPAIGARLRALLAAAAREGLSPARFAYVRAGSFPKAPKRFAAMLRDLGVPDQMQLSSGRNSVMIASTVTGLATGRSPST